MARSIRPPQSIGLYGALFLFLAVAFFLVYVRCPRHILLGVGAALVLYSTSGGELTGSILAGALLAIATYYLYKPRRYEGFEDAEEEDTSAEEAEVVMEEGMANAKDAVPAKKKAKAARKVAPPDNGDRAEMFELGKKYKVPSEEDDKDFHLDAGTTFMNAYKALKPEQITAMTKDTQELMETQKQLMSTLQTLKPLITDGKQMMDMFQSYFGAGNPSLN